MCGPFSRLDKYDLRAYHSCRLLLCASVEAQEYIRFGSVVACTKRSDDDIEDPCVESECPECGGTCNDPGCGSAGPVFVLLL